MHDLVLAVALITGGGEGECTTDALQTAAMQLELAESPPQFPSLGALQDQYTRAQGKPELYLRELLPDKKTCEAMLTLNKEEQARAAEEYTLTLDPRIPPYAAELRHRHRLWDKADDIRSSWATVADKREALAFLVAQLGEGLVLPAAVPYRGDK